MQMMFRLSNAANKKAEGVGIEPTGDKIFAPLTALKAGTATRRYPLPGPIYKHPNAIAIGVFPRHRECTRSANFHFVCTGLLCQNNNGQAILYSPKDNGISPE